MDTEEMADNVEIVRFTTPPAPALSKYVVPALMLGGITALVTALIERGVDGRVPISGIIIMAIVFALGAFKQRSHVRYVVTENGIARLATGLAPQRLAWEEIRRVRISTRNHQTARESTRLPPYIVFEGDRMRVTIDMAGFDDGSAALELIRRLLPDHVPGKSEL